MLLCSDTGDATSDQTLFDNEELSGAFFSGRLWLYSTIFKVVQKGLNAVAEKVNTEAQSN